MLRNALKRLLPSRPAAFAAPADTDTQNTANTAGTLLAAASILLLLWVLKRCRYGFDFTDEGYYLNAIVDPWLYNAAVTQFGLFYYPIFKALGEDIVLLRQFNVLSTWLLSIGLAWICVQGSSKYRPAMFFEATVATAIAAASFLFLSNAWLPTPSYNSLALQGLLVVALGITLVHEMLVTETNKTSRECAAGALVGAGATVVFLAKPTSALLLTVALLPMVYIAISLKRWRLVSFAALAALVVVVAAGLALGGSIRRIISLYQVGLEFGIETVRQKPFSDLFRFESLGIPDKIKLVYAAVALVTFMVLLARQHRVPAGSSFLGAAAAVAALSAVSIAIWPSFLWAQPQAPEYFYFNFVIGPPLFAVAAFAVILGWRQLSLSQGAITALVAVFYIICPYIFAFGTGSRVPNQALAALVFWPLGAALLVRCALPAEARRAALLLIAIIVVPATAWLLSNAMQRPYRQNAPLHLQTEPVRFGPAVLYLDLEAARYLRDVRAVGPSRGVPVLDFTGAHPGTLFALGAKAVGLAWIIGGYPRSDVIADHALSDIPCEVLAQTWILTAPTGHRAISKSLLGRPGLDKHGPEVGSFAGPTVEQRATQHFLPPPEDKAAARGACAASRQR
jgi:hypothetical protein